MAAPAAHARRPGLRRRGPPATEDFIRGAARRRGAAGPADRRLPGVLPPVRGLVVRAGVRWLLSTVPTAMIFDDHDVIDDWNTSRDWVREMRATGWWDERIVGGFMSYWCFQHLGNLSPEDRDEDAVLPRGARRRRATPAPIVRDFAFRADREVAGARWSYRRDVGRTRLVMMDSRAGRVLEPGRALDGRRRGVGLHRGSGRTATSTTCCWAPRCRSSSGAGMHCLEAWNEAVSDGAWGRLPRRRRAPAPGPRPRALGRVRRLAARARAPARARSPRGATAAAPGSVVLLSGDVHHAYLAEARRSGGRPRARRSTRRCARRCATRWTRASGARSAGASRAAPSASGARWRARPAWRTSR